jgi:hypothetical protein
MEQSMSGTQGLAEPPEGAIVGENVPVENDQEDIDEATVDAVAGELKAKPGYSELTETELREKAREFLRNLED